jgi:hypothetical protein
VSFKVSLRKLAKLVAVDAQRPVGKSPLAREAAAQRAAVASASPGGWPPELLAQAAEKVCGWAPTLEPGGEAGVAVHARFQAERDAVAGQEDAAVAARLGGGGGGRSHSAAAAGAPPGDAAKEASAKRARLRDAQARQAREVDALAACGPRAPTLTVREATPGGAAAKAGLAPGQRIFMVRGCGGGKASFYNACFFLRRPSESLSGLLTRASPR